MTAFTATVEVNDVEWEMECEATVHGYDRPATRIDPPEYAEIEVEIVGFVNDSDNDWIIDPDEYPAWDDFEESYPIYVESMLKVLAGDLDIIAQNSLDSQGWDAVNDEAEGSAEEYAEQQAEDRRYANY